MKKISQLKAKRNICHYVIICLVFVYAVYFSPAFIITNNPKANSKGPDHPSVKLDESGTKLFRIFSFFFKPGSVFIYTKSQNLSS